MPIWLHIASNSQNLRQNDLKNRVGTVLTIERVNKFKNRKNKDMSLVKRNSDWLSPSRMDSVFDRFFNDALAERSTTFNPRVDISETDKAFEIDLAVSRFDKNDFEVDLKDGLLMISGERKFKNKEDGKNLLDPNGVWNIWVNPSNCQIVF